MKLIISYCCYKPDLIIVPNYVADNLEKYKKEFDELIQKKNYEHGYWHKLPDGSKKFTWDNDTFIKWLNEKVIVNRNEKAEIVERDISPHDKRLELPKIYI